MLPIPERPCQILSTDVFDWDDKLHSALVDSCSGWFEIDPIKDMTSDTIINVLKVHFATHGVPEKLFSDNARYYISAQFQNLSKTWNFEHLTSSPRYPQSNDLAERAV